MNSPLFESFNSAPLRMIDGDRGKNYPNGTDFSADGDCLFLSARNVTKSGFMFEETSFISADKDGSLRAGKLRRGDVVITTRGTVGNVAYFDDSVPFASLRINSGMLILRTDESRLDSRYLYQFVRSRSFVTQIESLTSGSAQPQLPVRDLGNVMIPVPSMQKQRAIAEVLGALDDKIAANTKLAATSAELGAAYFNRAMCDAKTETTLGGILSLEYGKSLPASRRKPGLVDVYGSGGMAGSHDEALCNEPGVVVGRKGTAGAVHWAPRPFYPIDTTFYVVTHDPDVSQIFAYFLLGTLGLDEMNNDSAVPGLNRNAAHASRIRVPDASALRTFTEAATKLLTTTAQLEMENRSLAATRDSLLPQLMSGKLRVKDAEAVLEKAGV